MPEFTSKIIKGGALLEESRRLLEAWDDNQPANINLQRARDRNVLGKRSQKRVEDALSILRQRWVDPGFEVVQAARLLTATAEAFRDVCLYEAARNDDLLAHVAGDVLGGLARGGSVRVLNGDVETMLLRGPAAAVVGRWAPVTRTRVVHGLLSSLRDVGRLEGRAVKHLARAGITAPGFVYVLGRLRYKGLSSPALLTDPAWSWWRLTADDVRAQMLEADRNGVVGYADAGSSARLDWRKHGLVEMVHAVA